MASNAVEKELMEIFEKAKKAADKASADEYRKADEERCVDALKALHAFPITNQFLLATQLGKRLRTLTKHPRENIRTVASKLLDAWKKAAAAELSAKFNPKGPPKLPSTGKYNEPLLTKPEKEQVKSVTPEEEEMKRKVELSAESNTNHPPKFLIANDQKKAMISEEKKNKSLTIKSQDNVVQRLDREVLSNLEQNLDAEVLSNPEQTYVRPKTSSSDKSVTLKTSETNKIWSNPEQNYIRPKTSSSDKSVTPKTSGDDVVKKPKLKLSSPSNLTVPSKLPSHIGNKSAKSEDNRAKSAKVIISSEKEEKKPNRELSAESNPKGTPMLPCTVKRNQPLRTNSKEKQASKVKTNEPLRTNSEEKPAKSVRINKVSADKEGRKRKLELSPEFNTNRPPKIPTMAKPNDQKKTTMSEEKKDKSVKVKASGDNELKKPQQLELSSQSNLNVPPKLPSTAKCNDQWRDKVRESLLEAFSKVVHEVQGEELERVRGFDPVRVAVEVETVMFNKLGRSDSTPQLKTKYRSILFNLKDGKNPDLRRRVFTGEIKAEKLIVMTAEEMASDARKFENDMIKNKALFHCERGMKKAATTNEFKCGRCGKNETTYYQMQTRSADEPMTTYVTCTNCNNRWKFC